MLRKCLSTVVPSVFAMPVAVLDLTPLSGRRDFAKTIGPLKLASVQDSVVSEQSTALALRNIINVLVLLWRVCRLLVTAR